MLGLLFLWGCLAAGEARQLDAHETAAACSDDDFAKVSTMGNATEAEVLASGIDAGCLMCLAAADEAGGERRLAAWARKLDGHEGGDEMSPAIAACFGMGAGESGEAMAMQMVAESIGADADCQQADLDVIM